MRHAECARRISRRRCAAFKDTERVTRETARRCCCARLSAMRRVTFTLLTLMITSISLMFATRDFHRYADRRCRHANMMSLTPKTPRHEYAADFDIMISPHVHIADARYVNGYRCRSSVVAYIARYLSRCIPLRQLRRCDIRLSAADSRPSYDAATPYADATIHIRCHDAACHAKMSAIPCRRHRGAFDVERVTLRHTSVADPLRDVCFIASLRYRLYYYSLFTLMLPALRARARSYEERGGAINQIERATLLCRARYARGAR